MVPVLNWLNLLDQEGKLSITNLAVIVVLVKLTLAPEASLTEAGALLITLGNYALKRKAINDVKSSEVDVDSKVSSAVASLESRIADAESQVTAALLKVGLK